MDALNFRNKINVALESPKGAVLLMFAIILPIFLSFLALAVDGPLSLLKKARLSDGLNEAVLAIAAVNNQGLTDADRQLNNQILKNYLLFYMPTAHVDINNINVNTIINDGNIQYRANALVDIKSILPLEHVGLPSFGKNITLGNNGNVIKLAKPAPVDMILVVDFSRSMAKNKVPDGSDTRIGILRKVVDQVLTQGLKNVDSKFGILPYDIGVPVKVSTSNALGGQEVGCSVQFVPKLSYRINYEFWADKFVDLDSPLLNDPAYQWSKQEIFWKMDKAMSDYYINIVLPAAVGGASPDKQYLVNKGLCVKNDINQEGRLYGRSLYSCWKSDNSIFTNERLISNEYNKVITNLLAMRSPLEKAKGYRSIANLDSIDFTETMNKMFDPYNVTVFTQPWAPNLQEFRAFGEMCQSGMQMRPEYSPNVDVIREPDGYDSTRVNLDAAYNAVYSTYKNAKQNTYLIPLTNKKSDLAAFQTMEPSGGTDTIGGILRALPELMNSDKAKNDRRVMVVISDGFDSDSYGNAPADNLALARAFISRGLCDKIRAEFKNNHIDFNMYFISLSAANMNQNELTLWSTCFGADKVSTADSYQSLLSTLGGILQSETGYFIN